MQIILISGKQGSGKTTLVKAFEIFARNSNENIQFVGMKFADPLYKMQNRVLDVLDEYGFETPNKDGVLLQLLGTEWGRKVYGDDIWAKICRRRVDFEIAHFILRQEKLLIVIDDCRFPNELEIFPDAFKIRLHADRDVRKERCDAWRENENHLSETALDDVGPDSYDALYETGPDGLTPQEIVNLVWVTLESPR
jgi:energy-coupling factor transporter ATP-binding protein EcfA2